MDIRKLNNAAEAYNAGYREKVNPNQSEVKANKANSNQSEVKANKANSVQTDNKASFTKDAAKISISDDAKKLASDNKKVILDNKDGKVSVKNQSEKVTNLTGYTKSQVETLYRQRKISRNDYDQKMEKIENLKESATNKGRQDQIDKDQDRIDSRTKDTNNMVTEKKVSDNRDINNDNIKRGDNRVQDVQKEEKSDEKAKETTKETIENNRKQSEQFGKIILKEEDVVNENNAFKNATENGRVDLIKPLFDDEKTKEMQISFGNV